MIADVTEDTFRRYHPWIPLNRKCADDWKPAKIEWLVVAESPPCPRNEEEWLNPRYVYRVRDEGRRGTILAGAITVGFGVVQTNDLDRLKHRSRLDKLMKNHIFIMDVCEYPINQLGRNSLRIEIVRESLPGCFARRLKELNPNNLLVLGPRDLGGFGDEVVKGLEETFRSRVRNSGTIPFPHGGGHNFHNCCRGIRDSLKNQ